MPRNRPWLLRNKYNVAPKDQRTAWDGTVFQSKLEMIRYEYLVEMVRLGVIDDLARQVKYPVHINEIKICTYSSDFEYRMDGEKIIEDVKGVRTDVYKLKKKMVEALYGIAITEVTKKEVHDMEHPKKAELRKIYDRVQELRRQRNLPPYQPLVLEDLK